MHLTMRHCSIYLYIVKILYVSELVESSFFCTVTFLKVSLELLQVHSYFVFLILALSSC
jgi:hypothetical protein